MKPGKVSKWDVSDYESCSKGIENIYEKFGNIDILINNAGITRDTYLHKMSLENWKKVIDVNLNSIFNVTSLVINKMRNNQFGRIVHISSVNGQKGQFGQSNYAATKSALIVFKIIGFRKCVKKHYFKCYMSRLLIQKWSKFVKIF